MGFFPLIELDPGERSDDSVHFAVRIPPSHRAFEGHFPGHPVLPAIAQFQLLEEAIASAASHRPVRGCPSLRLKLAVRPGDELRIELNQLDGDAPSFRMLRGDDATTFGALTFTEGLAAGTEFPAAERLANGPVTDPRPLLPHGAAMHYLHAIEDVTPTSARGRGRLEPDNPFAIDGAVPSYVAIEAIAQTCAAHERCNATPRSGGPIDTDPTQAKRIGYLVAAREMAFSREPIPIEREFETSIVQHRSLGPLAEYSVRASIENQLLLTARFKTYVT